MTNGVMTKTKGLFTSGLCDCDGVIHTKKAGKIEIPQRTTGVHCEELQIFQHYKLSDTEFGVQLFARYCSRLRKKLYRILTLTDLIAS